MAPVEVVKNGGGWACVVINTVLSAFSFGPASPKNSTSLSNNVMISWDDLANIKISSANLKFKSGGKSSPRSNPNEHPSAHVRHFDIAQRSTEENSFGLSTHLCRTPALIWKVRLFPPCPVTSPCWPTYNFWRIHNMWLDTPCSDKANHRAPQSTRANAFDKSKLNTHTGMFAAKVLSMNKFAVSKCSSKRRPARKPCCSSGWQLSRHGCIRCSIM